MTATKEAHQPERDERLPQIDLAGRRASAAAASAASSPHSIIENNNYLYRPSCDNYILRYYYSTRFFGLSLDCTVRILLSYPLFHERREQHHHSICSLLISQIISSWFVVTSFGFFSYLICGSLRTSI